MSDRPDWRLDGRDWPNAAASHFVQAGGIEWHVQRKGLQGPSVVLLHGTGAATHSWRGVLPLLAEHASVLAMDLPGHGFSSTPPPAQMGLASSSAIPPVPPSPFAWRSRAG